MVSRKCWLFVGLLVSFANVSLGQTVVETSEKYWRDFELKRRRYAASRYQETELGKRQTTDEVERSLSKEDADLLDDLAPEQFGSESDSDQNDPESKSGFVWPELSIQEIRIDPRIPSEKIPEDRSYMLSQKFSRGWSDFVAIGKNYRWQAPCIRYQPLYFEDIALERYGQCRSGLVQAIASSGHFFKSAALLPFHMRHDPPYSCEYPLGYCRPGNCAPETYQRHSWR